MTGVDWAYWVPALEKMLADLKSLNAYLRGKVECSGYCKQVGIKVSSS
jgi:hypothetical protein